MNRAFIAIAASAMLALGAAVALAQPPAPLAKPSYTPAQAKRGEQVYNATCSTCHGDSLDNGQFGAPLKGGAFASHWGGKGLDEVYTMMSTQMPPTDPGGLGPAAYADVLAFILSKNGVAAGKAELPADGDALKALAAPG